MQGRAKKTTAVGAAAFVLASSAALVAPGTAEATVITGSCGTTIQGRPGDQVRVDPSSLLGLPPRTLPVLDLGIISPATQFLTKVVPGLGAVLGGLCRVTVNVAIAGAAPVESGAGAVNKAVTNGANALGNALRPGGGAPAKPPTNGGQVPGQTPGGGAPDNQVGGPGPGPGLGESNSPVEGIGSSLFATLPTSFTGFAPMSKLGGLPVAGAGLFAPAPGVRYGGQIPGYAPEFGILGEDGKKVPGNGVQNAGRAEALPSGSGGLTNGAGLPVLLAVLALSGVSAGLVRTWVLRRTTH